MQAATPTITTPRLTLRAFTKADAIPLHRILSTRDVLRYFPRSDPPSLERVERLIAGQLEHWEEYGYGWWAVDLQENGRLIGWNGLQFLPETGETELGYLLDKACWGQGLATEGARASIQYGFKHLGLDTIIGIVHPQNVASQHVLEKVGMSFTNRARYFDMDCYRYVLERAH